MFYIFFLFNAQRRYGDISLQYLTFIFPSYYYIELSDSDYKLD